VIGHQADKSKQPEESWCRASNRLVRPLPLGFPAQVPAPFFKGHFDIPAQDKPLDNLGRLQREGGTEEGTGWHVALRIHHQNPTDGERLLPRCMPERHARQHPQALPYAAIPCDLDLLAVLLGLVEPCFQCRQARSLLRFRPPLARWNRGWKGIEPCI